MKTILSLLLFLIVLINFQNAHASDAVSFDTQSENILYEDYPELWDNYLAEFQPIHDKIQIVNSRNEMVAAGTDKDEYIKYYKGIADFLTEIDGIKYYRLSFN